MSLLLTSKIDVALITSVNAVTKFHCYMNTLLIKILMRRFSKNLKLVLIFHTALILNVNAVEKFNFFEKRTFLVQNLMRFFFPTILICQLNPTLH